MALLVAIAGTSCWGQAYTAQATGNWTTTTTWSPNGTPGAGDTVSIGAFTITLTGATSIDGITFTGNGTVTGAFTLSLTGSATITTNTGVTGIVASVIGGTVGLTQSGSGTLELQAANTYTGTTTVNGTLQLDNAGTINASTAIVLNDNAYLLVAAYAGAAPATTFFNAASTLTMNNAKFEFRGASSNNRSTSIGTLVLNSGVNEVYAKTNFGGTVTITFTSGCTRNNNAILIADVRDATNDKVVITGATAGINTWMYRWNPNLDIWYPATYSGGVIASSNTQFSTAASGNWDDTVNTWTPTGTVPTSSNDMKFNGAHAIDLNGANRSISAIYGFVNSNGNASITGGAGLKLTVANNIVLNSQSFSPSMSITCPTLEFAQSAGGTANEAVVLADSANAVTISSAITGTDATFATRRASSVVLSGANAWTGKTTVANGNLSVSGGSAIPDGSAVILHNVLNRNGNATTLTLNANETVGSIAGGGSISGNIILGANTLTCGGDNTSTTYAGAISGTGSLTKNGTGMLTLSGTSSYSGGTTVGGGSLHIGTASAIGTGTLTMNAGSTYAEVQDGITLSNALTFNGGGQAAHGEIELPSGATAATISGAITVTAGSSAGGIFAAQSGTLTVSGVITAAGNLKPNSRLGTVVLSGGGTGYVQFGIGQDTVKVGATNGMSTVAVVDLAVSSTATLDLNGFSQTLGGLTRTNANSATVTSGSGTPTLTLAPSASQTYAGVITGPITLVINGTASQTLSGANTYTGTTTVSAGTLSIANATGLGTTAAGTTVSSGGCLDLNGVAVGAEALTLNGTGVSSGGALTGTGTASLSGAVTLASNSSIGGTGNLTLSGVISGTGFGLTKVGSGTLTLSTATETYTGATTVSAGTLYVNTTDTASSSFTVNGGTLAGTGSVSGITCSSGTVFPGASGSTGTLTSTANCSISGGLQCRISALATHDVLALGTHALTLSGSPTLTLDLNGLATMGTVQGIVTTSAVGTGSFGTITLLNNPSNYTANVVYNASGGRMDIVIGDPGAPTIDKNTGISVAPGGTALIDNNALHASDSDDSASNVTFTLVTAPTHGGLRKYAAGAVTQIAQNGTFTEADLDANAISYEHGDTLNPSTNDAFQVKVTDASGNFSAVSTVTVTLTSSTGLTYGLWSYFPFEQTSGTSAPDAVGTESGTVIGTPSWGAGPVGDALTFDGSTTWVALPSINTAAFSGGFSAGFWLKPTAVGTWARVFDFSDIEGVGGTLGVERYSTTDNFNLVGVSSGWATASTPMIDNAWHHYVFTDDGTTGKFYRDGILTDSASMSPMTSTVLKRCMIGHSNFKADALFTGSLDELRFYSRALTADDVVLLSEQAAPTVGALGGPVSYTGGAGATAATLAASATFSDNDDLYEAGGYLLVGNGVGNTTSTLSVGAVGSISVVGSTVSFAGNAIGTIDGTLNGASGADLKIAFNTVYATPAAVQGLLRAVQFKDTATAGFTRTVSFTVSDGLCTPTPATLTVNENTPTNLAVTTNSGISCAAGGVKTITSAMLAATGSATAANITFTVSTAASHGAVRKNAAAATTFTQADINNGIVSYEHGDLASATDSFTVTVADNASHTAGPVKVSVTTTGTGLGSGLVGYWPLDDGSGTTAADRSGQGNTATLGNAPTWGTGKISGDLTFNGSNQYAAITPPVNNSFSIVYWFKTSDTNAAGAGSGSQWWQGGGLVDGEMPGLLDDFGTSFGSNGGYVFAGVGNYHNADNSVQADLTIQQGGGYNDGTWHQVAVTRSNANEYWYSLQVDDNAGVWLGAVNDDLLTSPTNLYFGGNVTDAIYFNGSMDDIRIFNRALTADEIATLWNSTGDAAPTIANLNGDAPSGFGAIAIDAGGDATVSDSDDLYLAGGWLLVENVTGCTLSIAAAGGIATSGSTVAYSSNTIGTIDATLDGTSGKNLKVLFTTQYAAPAAASALIHALRFTSTSLITAGIRVTVSDGLLVSSPCTTTVTTVLVDNGLTVASGGAVTAETTALAASQAGSTSAQITWTLLTPPAHGFLRKNLAALGTNGTFTEADIENDAISYEHGDLANASDSFVVSVAGLGGTISASTTVAVTVSGTGLADGLQAWWKLDESPVATTASDSSGNGYAGTLTNMAGAEWTTGQVDGALAFNGSTSYVDVPSAPSLANGSFTVTAWVQRQNNNAFSIFLSQGTATVDFGLHLGFRPSNVLTMGFWGDDIDSPGTYTDLAWHHCAGTFVASSQLQSLYVDGVLVSTRISNGRYQGSGDLQLGDACMFSAPFQGPLDEVRVYNRTLSAGEIALIYHQAAPVIANLAGDRALLQGINLPTPLDVGFDATVTDADDLCEAAGYLLIENLTSGTFTTSTLSVLAGNGITIAGSTVSYSGQAIGTVNATKNGLTGNNLEIDFSTQYATPAAIAALIHELRYTDASDSFVNRSLRVTVSDGALLSVPAVVTVAHRPHGNVGTVFGSNY